MFDIFHPIRLGFEFVPFPILEWNESLWKLDPRELGNVHDVLCYGANVHAILAKRSATAARE